MRVSRIFVQDTLTLGQQIKLSDSRAHYIGNVLRSKSGDPLTIFNGLGGEYSARILEIKRNQVVIDLIAFDSINRQSGLTIELGLAITKRESMDTAIAKATELGVAVIAPLVCAYTPIPLKSIEKKLKHWQEVCFSACEQCGLNIPPTIKTAVPFNQWVSVSADLRLIANQARERTIKTISANPANVAVTVGPEGGFSLDEMAIAEASGFLGINLGPRIQRTETAATTMVSLIQSQWGDL